MITRHFVDVGARRVHYRRTGDGPPLLLVHQSPRSSAEYEPMMREWAKQFTIYAPDTPGFGQSTPLPLEKPEVEDYADAAVAFMDAVGLGRVPAYGYHSGAITLVTALKRRPERFNAVAANGYAVWTPKDREALGDPYVPPFHPTRYGEHLVWVWNRLLEQTWFFPWYDVREETRLSIALDDPAYVQAMVVDLLAAGNAYAAGYSAMIRAPRDVPGPGGPPVLVCASKRDPLYLHLDRLGELPPEWRKAGYDEPPQAVDACLEHLLAHPAAEDAPPPAETADEGYVAVRGALIHWKGDRASGRVHLPGLGGSVRALGPVDGYALDLPGHGLSDALELGGLDAWADAVAEAVTAVGQPRAVVGHGFSALLACAVAARLGVAAEGEWAALPHPADLPAWAAWLPSTTPERYGEHLIRAWGAARAQTFFWPPHAPRAAHAIPFAPEDAAPERLREVHLGLAQARGGAALLKALAEADWDALIRHAKPTRWHLPAWAEARQDVWRPHMEG